MRLYLVDGTYELFRAYFGAPGRTNSRGEEVGATRTYLRGLARLIQDAPATHIACAFDTVIESFRNALFPGYKTGDGIPDDLWSQFPLVEEVTQALGVTAWSMMDFEADDALATAAAKFADDPRVEQIVICTPDKDLMQCVSDPTVVCWDRLRERVYDEGEVKAKWGVPPLSIPDWLALVGDSADGIPGIPRWGAKSAAAVLAHYRRIEAIPKDASYWEVAVRGAARLSSQLEAQRDDAMLYRTLATLRKDVPLPESLDDLACRGPNPGALRNLGERLNDTELVERILGDAP